MKTVFIANKSSYGTGFFGVFNTLLELKQAIVDQETGVWDDDKQEILYGKYSEEMAKDAIEAGEYELAKINLHDEEEIDFHEYDGQSSFFIKKKVVKILSTIDWDVE